MADPGAGAVPHHDAVGVDQPGGASYRPSSIEDLAPSGQRARFTANVAAIETVRLLQSEQRPATPAEQLTLARWSSWGALPQVFDESNSEWARQRDQLRGLLSGEEYAAARRTTINAHYTDPAYVEAIWRTLQDLGFTTGRVLEPGCGSGTFIGMAPPGAEMYGIELDGVTAAIARGLYPNAEVRAESFAESRLPRDHFDLTVGNVPFADVTLHDPVFNSGHHSLHNHFILKSLALTRPGGIVAVLTSSFTLDAVNPAARREMIDLADLIGAVRLPTGAHRRAAGTDSLMDLVILRRREAGEEPRGTSWERSIAQDVGGQQVRLNTHFADHPERVLGRLHVGQGMYGGETLHVIAHDLTATPARFAEQLEQIVSDARRDSLVYTPAPPRSAAQRAQVPDRPTNLWDGTILAVEEGFGVAKGGILHDLEVPKAQAGELRQLLELRDGARALLDAESTAEPDEPGLEEMRTALHDAYTAYVSSHGPLNRYTLRRTGRRAPLLDPTTAEPVLDPETGQPVPGEDVYARITPRVLTTFRQDPYSALVKALERFDEEEQTSAPAALLRQRMVAPRSPSRGADTPAEAIAICLNESGSIDLDRAADLLGVDPQEAREQLSDLVYDDPHTGDLVHAPEYLSGDVRTKLDQARAAAAEDARFAVNVAALEAAQPDPIGIEEIEARLGAVWISPQIHRQFLVELLDDTSVRVENPLPGAWEVRGGRYGVRATNHWGTERRPATDIAQALMEQRRIEVRDEIEDVDGRVRLVLNEVETAAAQEKADAIQERFSTWVWEDPARAADLGEVYNRRFNSIRLRDYSQAGDYLTLPGLAATLTLRPHQRAAVARMIAEPATGLFHQVGAGKTLEMIAGAMEMRRMGLVSKPLVVVPNHMLEQFSREWLQAYPRARVLAASTQDLKDDKRRLFVARAAANDWDGVILTQSAFKRIGVSPDFQTRYIDAQLHSLRAALETARGENAMSVKRIEKRIMALEERYKASLDTPRDPGVSFEETGVDYLIVDEAHMYKNLATVSNIADAAILGSQQATDLHMKLEYLRQRHGGRVVTMATATPLANSITEAYVMQRYLRPDLLENAGVTSFDGWAATFGSQVTEMEMGPAGGFRLKTRFSRFQNVPEMLRMWHVFADVKTSEDLQLPVPRIAPRPSDGAREVETVVLEPTPEVEDYIAAIADRAELVAARRVSPDEDNMLKISTDGRKAALDPRLVEENMEPTGPSKLDAVAERILTHWAATRDNTYRDEVTGEISPIRGGLQLVFSDLGTPNENRWDAYTELRGQLIRAGMPADSVRFIHDARSDSEKARLFAAARAGHVAVLIGSTAKMGVGTNVQNRLTAMHHVDCPWRPADLEQRDGRGIRQGNQNPEVAIYRYVVERSFDAYSWQTVARKATFIAQIMRGRLDSREIEDIGDTALSAAEAKALASGNPLILEKANADSALAKLRRQETAHHRAQSALAHTRQRASDRIDALTGEIQQLRTAVLRTRDVSGSHFQMTVGERIYDQRAAAADAIAALVRSRTLDWSPRGTHSLTLGQIAGHTIELRSDPRRFLTGPITLGLANVPRSTTPIDLREATEANIGLVRTLENKTTAITRHLTRAEQDLAAASRDLAEAEAHLGTPFPHAANLNQAQARVHEIAAALHQTENAAPSPPSAPSTPERSHPSRGPHDPLRLGLQVPPVPRRAVPTLAERLARVRDSLQTPPTRPQAANETPTARPDGPRL